MNEGCAGSSTAAKEDKPLILIVDDSPTIRMSLKRAVEDEFQPLEAEDGEVAWTLLLQDADIELLITDLTMPHLDGFGLIRRLRENHAARMQNLPVIVVTGADDTAARERAFHAGANDFLTKDSDRIELLARLRAHLKLAQTIRQLEASQCELRAQANTDALTGLANRRFFDEIAGKELSLMRRQQDYFSVLMIDIDHFKTVNDTHGHPVGDEILKRVAATLSDNLREEDTVARIGGEEFVVCSPATNRLASIVLAERLRKAVESLTIKCDGRRIPVTISLGIALRPLDGDDLQALLSVADERLYRAKQDGRNRFCVADKVSQDDDGFAVDRICPRMDTALAMIRHGNLHRLKPHLSTLLQELIPFLELVNQQSAGAKVDVGRMREIAENLKD
ncbi:MAG TPA: diguanylate cyclase [Gammaproteobacteria bacterium]|nr:diguanylate cyclase [Gammaproteobacteria bacterium]